MQGEIAAGMTSERVEQAIADAHNSVRKRGRRQSRRWHLPAQLVRGLRWLVVDERVYHRVCQELLSGRPAVEEGLTADAGICRHRRESDHVLGPEPVQGSWEPNGPEPRWLHVPALVVEVGVNQPDGCFQEMLRRRVMARRRLPWAHRSRSSLLWCRRPCSRAHSDLAIECHRTLIGDSDVSL